MGLPTARLTIGEDRAVEALEQVMYERQREVLEDLLRPLLAAVQLVEGVHVHLGLLAARRARVGNRHVRGRGLEVEVLSRGPLLLDEVDLATLLLRVAHRAEAHAHLHPVARSELDIGGEGLGQADTPLGLVECLREAKPLVFPRERRGRFLLLFLLRARRGGRVGAAHGRRRARHQGRGVILFSLCTLLGGTLFWRLACVDSALGLRTRGLKVRRRRLGLRQHRRRRTFGRLHLSSGVVRLGHASPTYLRRCESRSSPRKKFASITA